MSKTCKDVLLFIVALGLPILIFTVLTLMGKAEAEKKHKQAISLCIEHSESMNKLEIKFCKGIKEPRKALLFILERTLERTKR